MSDYYSTLPVSDDGHIHHHADLLCLLTIVQACDVELLPITWQPGLELLGRGGTARVSQSQVHRQLGFAYKRMETVHRRPFASSYQYMISEILALKAPLVTGHPNIIKLEGVCWEIENEEALPVLIFPKAAHGNLRAFVESELGRSLSLDDRIALSIDIAKGIMALHESGIIHCDIKPENILVDQNDTGDLIAKVSDLGYAHITKTSEDLVHLPQARPWTDPRWHLREFSIHAAKMMDMHSYGMLCLWLLLGGQILEYLENTSFDYDCDSGHQSFFVNNDAPYTKLELLQRDDKLTIAVHHVLERISFISDSQKKTLSQFFGSLLPVSHESRESDFRNLVSLLSGQPRSGVSYVDMSDESSHNTAAATLGKEKADFRPEHADFRIATCNYRLCSLDYRVRSTIFKALVLRTDKKCDTYCEACSRKASFQLAVCYALGFGVARNEELSKSRLVAIDQTPKQLQTELEHIKSRTFDSTYTQSRYRSLFDQGFIHWENLPRRYRRDRVVSSAESVCKREISDMECVLGANHPVVFQLKYGLVSVLEDNHKLDEAEALQSEVAEGLQKVFGEKHPDSIATMGGLRDIWMKQGRWNKACELAEKGLKLRLSEQGPHHPSSWVARGKLAEIYFWLGRLKDAEQEQLFVVDMFTLSFGKDHPQTLLATSHLATTLREQGRIQESLLLQEEIMGIKKAVLGPSDPEFLVYIGQLAVAYESAGKLTEAESKFLEALQGMQASLGEDDKLTVWWERRLGDYYTKCRKFETGEQFYRRVIDRFTKNAGMNHFDTLTRVVDLANLYAIQGRSAEARKLILEVLCRQKTALTAGFPIESSIARINIGHADLEEDELSLLLKFADFGKNVEQSAALDALAIYCNVAGILVKLGDLETAKVLLVQVVEGHTMIYGSNKEETLQSISSLAATCHMMGEDEAAEDMWRKARQERLSKNGAEDSTFLDLTEELASMMDVQERSTESLPLHEQLVETSVRILGDLHPHTLKRVRKLCMVYVKQENWSKVESLNKDLFFTVEKRVNIGHESALLAGAFLFKAYHAQQKWPEAVDLVELMVQVAEVAYGPDKARTLFFRAQLASCLAANVELQRSILECRRVIEGLQKTKGDSGHAGILDILSSLALDYFDHGQQEMCEELLVEVIKNARQALGPQHRITQVSQSNLEGVRRARKGLT